MIIIDSWVAAAIKFELPNGFIIGFKNYLKILFEFNVL